jgi:ABC-type multidrug transport system ATPase subunit
MHKNHISIRNVSHTYPNGNAALTGVNLEIETGLFGLLGANGAGKSTLMRIICSLQAPTAGTVAINGHDVVTERRAIRQQIGYLSQDFGAWHLYRVREVLDTLAELSGMTGKEQRATRVDKVLEDVGLNKVADRKVKKLSGGMLRRLGVAQALVHEPRVLVMDEPTVGLDPEERLRFRKVMSDLSQERIIILSTHIVADLGSGCRDIALINEGKLEFSGAPVQLIEQARGRVLEYTVSPAEELELHEQLEVVARTAAGGNRVTLRGVLKDSAVRTSVPGQAVDKITLEEAYLAFVLNQGRHLDEQEMEALGVH